MALANVIVAFFAPPLKHLSFITGNYLSLSYQNMLVAAHEQ